MNQKALMIIGIFIIAVLAISCTPPGAQNLEDLQIEKSTNTQTEASDDAESKKSEPVDSTSIEDEKTSDETDKEEKETTEDTKEEEVDTSGFTEKKEVCREGTRSCKGTKLIECRSGKLLKKEDCGSRGCYVDHCGECDPDVPKKCDGNKLVTCTADARKKTTNCYRCENNKCLDAPENPAALKCSRIQDIEVTNPEALSVYSPFKKANVDQELLIMNDVQDEFEIARIFKNGAFDTVKGTSGKSPIYLELSKCYIYCALEVPLELEIQCQDSNQVVTATIPPHSASSSKPIRFFVAEEGSTYYGDDQQNGQGTPLTQEEDIYKKEQLAVKAKLN